MASDKLSCVVALSWPCLTQSEWAAWVQAIGSIVAILAAIAIAAWQYHVAKKDREDADRAARLDVERQRRFKARSLVLDALPHLTDYIATLRMLQGATETRPFRISLPDLVRELDPTEMLRGYVRQSVDVGPVSRSLQDMVLFASNASSVASNALQVGIRTAAERFPTYEDEIYRAICNASTEAQRARQGISEMFGEDRR